MYGQPYFYGKEFDGGWWNPSKSGWFFKRSHLDMLLERGAHMETSMKFTFSIHILHERLLPEAQEPVIRQLNRNLHHQLIILMDVNG